MGRVVEEDWSVAGKVWWRSALIWMILAEKCTVVANAPFSSTITASPNGKPIYLEFRFPRVWAEVSKKTGVSQCGLV